MLRNGVCSWTDKSLIDCGKFYKKKGDTQAYLQYYSTRLGTVEVDASTYTIPTQDRVKKWLAATPEGFCFHFKAHQIFTHQQTEYSKLPRLIREDFNHPQGPTAKDIDRAEIPLAVQEQLMFLFNLALQEAVKAGKMGIALFQFPETFQCSDENKELIRLYRKWLDASVVMGLELRSKSWYFDATDFADLKALGRPEPMTTDEPRTNRMKDTESFVRSLPKVTWVAVDEYVKRDTKPSQVMPYPARVVPILTQCIGGDELYVRVHRRVGEDRLLTDQELADWAYRIQHYEPRPRRIWFLWNTNFEMQAIDNAARLEKLLPAELVFDWKAHYLSVRKADKGSIFAFFGASPKKPAAASQKNNDADDNDDDEDDLRGGEQEPDARETTPPLPTKKNASPPPPSRGAPAPKQPAPKKRAKKAGEIAGMLQEQSMQSFFKPKE